MSLRENLLLELSKLRTNRERPYPIQAKKPKLKLQQSKQDTLLQEAQKLLGLTEGD